jgi:hypothetical protein
MDHLRGFENLPDTIEKANEVWSYWENPKVQRVVIRNYILIGEKSDNFVVTTRDGVVEDTNFVTNSRLDNYRKGVILYETKRSNGKS